MSEKEQISIEITTGSSLQNIKNLDDQLKRYKDRLVELERHTRGVTPDLLAQYKDATRDVRSLQNTLSALSNAVKNNNAVVDGSHKSVEKWLTGYERLGRTLDAITGRLKSLGAEAGKASKAATASSEKMASVSYRSNLGGPFPLSARETSKVPVSVLKQAAELEASMKSADAAAKQASKTLKQTLTEAGSAYASLNNTRRFERAEEAKSVRLREAAWDAYQKQQNSAVEASKKAAWARVDAARKVEVAEDKVAKKNLERLHDQQVVVRAAHSKAFTANDDAMSSGFVKAAENIKKASASMQAEMTQMGLASVRSQLANGKLAWKEELKLRGEVSKAWDSAYKEDVDRHKSALAEKLKQENAHGAGIVAMMRRRVQEVAATERGLLADAKYRNASEKQQLDQSIKAAASLRAGRDVAWVKDKYGSLATGRAREFGLQSLVAEMGALGSKTDQVEGSVGRLGHAYRAGGGHAQAFTESQHAMHSALRGVSGSLGALWLTYGKYISIMVAATAATEAARRSFTQGADLEYQSQYAAVLSNEGPAPRSDVENIRSELIKVTDGTKFNALEASEGLRVLAQTGIDAKDGLGMLKTVMSATVFGETDMKTATEGLTSAMEQFGLRTNNAMQNAKNIERVGDAMAYVSVETKAGMGDVAESFKNMIGLSQRYGLSLEEASVVLEKVGKQGLTGGIAGTRARNMFEDLLGAPNNQTAARIREILGMDMFVKGRDNPLVYIQQVIDKYRELDSAKRQQFDANMLNERGRVVFSALVGDTENLVDALDRATNKSKGLLDRLSDGLKGNVKTAFQTAMASLENAFMQAMRGSEGALLDLAQTLDATFRSDGFRQGLRDLIKLLSDAMKWVLDNTDTIKQLLVAYLALKGAGVISGLALDLGKFSKGLKDVGGVAETGVGVVDRLTRSFNLLVGVLSAGSLGRVLALLATNPVVGIAVTVTAAAATYAATTDDNLNGVDYRADARRASGLQPSTDISQLGRAEVEAALSKNEKEFRPLDGYLATWQKRDHDRYNQLKADNEALTERLDVLREIERVNGKSPQKAAVKLNPNEGDGFNIPDPRKAATAAAAERSEFKRIDDVRRLAEAGYEAQMVTVEHAKKVWEAKSRAEEVGAEEYFRVQEGLASKEVELGLAREEYVQNALKNAIASGRLTADGRERADLMLQESQQKVTMLKAKAESEKLLKQDDFDRDTLARQKKFHEDMLKLEAGYNDMLAQEQGFVFGQRLADQEAFMTEWAANEGKMLQRAQELGNTGAIDSIMAMYRAKLARFLKVEDAPSGYTNAQVNYNKMAGAPDGFYSSSQMGLAKTQAEYEKFYTYLAAQKQAGAISDDMYAAKQIELETRKQTTLRDLTVQGAEERLAYGTGGWEDMMLASLGRVAEGFTTFSAGVGQQMGNLFTTLTDGFADSLGRAIVYGEDLNQAMANVARQGLAALISGLIKLGIQWLITSMLGQTIQAAMAATMVATNAATAGAVASAWAPAAALASLATLGTNSTAAITGMLSTMAVSQGIAATSMASAGFAGAFDEGGTIPAGKWGIAGEYGPEVIQGPATITSRRETAELLRGNAGGDSGETQVNVAPPNVNIKNINVLDPSVVGDYLNTDEGERVIMNVFQRNRQAIGV